MAIWAYSFYWAYQRMFSLEYSPKDQPPDKYTIYYNREDTSFQRVYDIAVADKLILNIDKDNATGPQAFKRLHVKFVKLMAQELDIYGKPKDMELIGRYLHWLDPKPATGWTLQEIALICIYTRQAVDSSTAGDILKKYNPNLTSERKLREHYNQWIHPADRTSLTEIEATDRKRIKSLIRIIDHLEANQYKTDQAKAELQTLQDKIKSRYY